MTPQSTHSQSNLHAESVADEWLARFSHIASLKPLASTDIASIVQDTFLPNGWFRDSFAFTWDTRSINGLSAIEEYLSANIGSPSITGLRAFKLDCSKGLEPKYGPLDPEVKGVEFAFTFETDKTWGRGYARLVHDPAAEQWKAITMFMKTEDLKGYEEAGHEEGASVGHAIAWEDVQVAKRKQAEESPEVVIIGAGPCGLNIAACLKQMNIRAIVVEQHLRVGDNWRMRYPTLSLHTTKSFTPFLYQPFPKNWPTYAPREKMAAWMEQYSIIQELVVWTNSTVLPTPTYDETLGSWSVFIRHQGAERTSIVNVHPNHVIMATGYLSSPNLPNIPSSSIFGGPIIHSSRYAGGESLKGKDIVVVGAANSAADICQNLYACGAKSITMLQRSETCICPRSAIAGKLLRGWPEDEATEISDLKMSSLPFAMLKHAEVMATKVTLETYKDMYEGLRKAGLKVTMGKDGGGLLVQVFERGGGFAVDVGCSKLIIEGKVKVKHGSVQEFTADSVILDNRSEVPADAVIYATGYKTCKVTVKDIFGQEVCDRTPEIWGTDSEGEMRGIYRPTGHPGMWFAAGDFMYARRAAKQLAIQIKAVQVKLFE